MYTPELERLLRAAGGGPPRRTGWQQSGDLIVGGGQPVTMQYDFGETDTYTVGFLQPVAGGNDIGMRAEALIMWNVEGTYKPVRVSLVGGMSVTAAAQGVKVIMSDATPAGNAYAPAGTQYNVSCQVARGTRGFASVPPYYIPQALATEIQVNTGGPASDVVVPTDAGAQSVFITIVNSDFSAVNKGDAYVTQRVLSALAPGHPAGINLSRFDPIQTTGWVPLVPGCTDLLLNNNGAKNQLWAIVFGVDG